MTLMLECRMQTVKAVKTIQAETSEDFSSADEWQTAKAGLRRSASKSTRLGLHISFCSMLD